MNNGLRNPPGKDGRLNLSISAELGQFIEAKLVDLASESHDKHGCPDHSSRVPELAQQLVGPLSRALDLKYSDDDGYRQLGEEVNKVISDFMKERGQTHDKIRFMTYSWSGSLLGAVVNY